MNEPTRLPEDVAQDFDGIMLKTPEEQFERLQRIRDHIAHQRAVMEAMAMWMFDRVTFPCAACPYDGDCGGKDCKDTTPADILAHFEAQVKGWSK